MATKTKQLQDRTIKSEKIDWRKLKWLQHPDLKELTETEADSLIGSFDERGIIRGFNVWDDGEEIWILDGCHMQKILEIGEKRKLWTVPDLLTANFIQCDDRADAADLVLAYSSIFAKLTYEGLDAFMAEHEMDLDKVFDTLDFPDIDVDYWNEDFGGGGTNTGGDVKSKKEETKEGGSNYPKDNPDRKLLKMYFSQHNLHKVKIALKSYGDTLEEALLKLLEIGEE